MSDQFSAVLHRKRTHLVSVSNHLVCIVITAMISLTALAGAAARGSVEGNVADPSGAKVVGARVALRDATGVVAYQTLTDSEGKFTIADVSEGRYSVTVEAPGFSQTEKITVDVRASVTQNIAVRLNVAAISDHIVVTATRTETFTGDLGGSVSVITNEDLARANQTLVSEPLRLVPALAVVQTGGRGGLTSIFTRGGESDYNKVLIDDVPVNEAGGLFDFAFLTPENLERIEVVRGSQSALFGSDAMTSVIQLVTRRGSTPAPEFEFSGEGGSFDFHRESARLSGLTRWFDYSTSFGYQTTDGRFRNSDYINRSASANLGFRITPSAELRVTSRWSGNTLGVPGPTAALFADPDQRQKHHDLSLAAALNLKTTSRLHQKARFIYSESNTHSFDPVAEDLTKPGTPPLPPGAFGADFVFDFRDHQKRAGLHYQAIASVSSSNVITAGIDFEHESAVFTSADSFSRSRVSPVRNSLGFYVQDQAAWRERLFLTAGVRVERNRGNVPSDLRAALASLGSVAPSGDVGFGVTANPKIAVSLFARRHTESATVDATRLKASFGTGIKEPTLVEAFSPNLSFLGNPGLDPERAVSFDVGAVQEFFGRRVSVELTYYDNRFRDQIVFESTAAFGPIRLPNGILTNFVNSDRASARGIELIGSARPGGQFWSRLRVLGSYTFLRSRLDRAADVLTFPPPTFQGVFARNPEIGLPLLRRPRHTGTFEVSWIDRRFDISFDGSIVGKRRDADPVTFAKFDNAGRPIFNDAYAKLNAAGSYHISNLISVFARVENLLNQDYQEVLGFPAYRLNFSAGLRVRVGGRK